MVKVNQQIIVGTAARDDIILRISKVLEGTKIMEVWNYTTFRSVEETRAWIEKEAHLRHGITSIEWSIDNKT